MNKFLKTLVLLLVGLLIAGNAFAMSITLESGTDSAFIIDDLSGDLDSTAGRMMISESVGSWVFSMNIATSQPTIGSNDQPMMELTSVSASSTSEQATTLTITLTDTFANAEDLTTVGSVFSMSAASLAAGGSVTYSVIFDNGDTVYSGTYTNPIHSFQTILDAYSLHEDTDPAGYDISIVMEITHGAGYVNSNLNASLDSEAPSSVPVPATLSLLSMGLLAFAGISRRKAA